MDCSIRGSATPSRRGISMAISIKGRTTLVVEEPLFRQPTDEGRLRGFLRRFGRNKGACASALILAVIFVTSLDAVGSRIATDNPTQILVGPKLSAPDRANP